MRTEIDMAWILDGIAKIKESKPTVYRYFEFWIRRKLGDSDPESWCTAVKALPNKHLEEFAIMLQRALEL